MCTPGATTIQGMNRLRGSSTPCSRPEPPWSARNDDHHVGPHLHLIDRVEEALNLPVGLLDGGHLLGRTPAVLVTDGIHVGEMHKHHLGLVLVDALDRLVAHGHVGGNLLERGDPLPVEGARPGQDGEFALAGDHGSTEAGVLGQFHDGGEGGVDGLGEGQVVVELDAMAAGRDAGDHTGVRGQGDGHAGGHGPHGVGALVHEGMDGGGFGAEHQVGSQTIDADDQHAALFEGDGRLGGRRRRGRGNCRDDERRGRRRSLTGRRGHTGNGDGRRARAATNRPGGNRCPDENQYHDG